ncbi:MAG: hypothetical protein A2V81_04410 [Candidatus Abawacabacteria bacterium RBG_16_42_10]|uniref:Uncharacterized protein n=1 Tax=Candidatus Abawacabacteria bacterium RBG_16_42_10 TaxID=1817814 RepID=A0A1F4XIG3_9BACT|nr:MAG: hypothetical protein A2V81_04410 [Candidatus Abawacabacteria bacterium RBG_16_42_10]
MNTDTFFSKLNECLIPRDNSLYVDGWSMKKLIKEDPNTAKSVAWLLLLEIKNKIESGSQSDIDKLTFLLGSTFFMAISEEISDNTFIKEYEIIMKDFINK